MAQLLWAYIVSSGHTNSRLFKSSPAPFPPVFGYVWEKGGKSGSKVHWLDSAGHRVRAGALGPLPLQAPRIGAACGLDFASGSQQRSIDGHGCKGAEPVPAFCPAYS